MTSRPAALARRLDTAWRARSEIARELQKPASDARIKRAEKKLGVKLPPALVALYKLHDGTGYGAIDGYYRLLSLDEIAKLKQGNDELEQGGIFSEWRPGEWWNAAWVPFLDFEGDYVCLDTASGEVVEFLAYRQRRARLYASAYQWLGTLAELTAAAEGSTDLEEFLRGRRAARIRKQLNPGYPIRRMARRRRAPRPSKSLVIESQAFERGPYHWSIELVGPLVRTWFGRAYSARSADKGFADAERARRYRDQQIEKKLSGGYTPRGPMTSSHDDHAGVIAAARRHMRSLRARK